MSSNTLLVKHGNSLGNGNGMSVPAACFLVLVELFLIKYFTNGQKTLNELHLTYLPDIQRSRSGTFCCRSCLSSSSSLYDVLADVWLKTVDMWYRGSCEALILVQQCSMEQGDAVRAVQ